MRLASPWPTVVVALTTVACSAAPDITDRELRQPQQPETPTTTPRAADVNRPDDAQNDTWRVSYSDHSGNYYRFWKAAGDENPRFAYDPINPERS